jgi:Protein of unknown function (DUF3224)
MTTLETRLDIKSWDEKPYRELPDGTRYARAEVTLAGTGTGGDTFTDGAFESLLYYRSDGTSTYVALMSLTASLGGRSGGIVLAGEGTYDGTTAVMSARVVDATGELAGLTGTATSTSTHADYPQMPLVLTYDLG